MSIVHYSDLARRILEEETDYIQGKKLISSFFSQSKNKKVSLETIKLRLVIIDSMYSTQMNKRLFGIDDLAYGLYNLSENYDYLLVKKVNQFLNGSNTDVRNFFDTKFGIDKTGKDYGLAISLISKYLYFLLDYNFPIYDRLVKDYLPKINQRFDYINECKLPKSVEGYFSYIVDFNKKSKINNFNQLDNFCWLYGKIHEGSFSLLINKEKYLDLISYSSIESGLKSSKIDAEIARALKRGVPNIYSRRKK